MSEPELNIRDKRPEDQCVDEMTLLLYAERQLDREAAQGVSLHTQTCTRCLTLLRALDRESRLLTRSMLEQDEPLPARLAEFQAQVKRNMQWIWGVIFGLAVLGVYALYTGYIEPWERQFEQAGFGGSNLLSLVVFQGAFWKGWQSMFSLVEVFAVVTMVGFGLFAFRRFLRRGSAMAVLFSGLGLMVAMAPAASATEFRKGDSVTVKKDEVIKGDLFVTGKHVRIEGEVDGDVYAFAEQVDVTGRINGDLIGFVQTERISGVIDGNLRTAANNVTITGTVERSVLTWNQVFNLDSGGKIGRSLTAGGQTLTVDGKVDGDFLSFSESTSISGFIGGSVKGRGKSLSIGSGAEIDGKTVFYGEQPPSVASDAKLGSSPEFTKAEHHAHERDAGYYVWRIIWTGAVILFGLVLAGVMPKFAKETVESGGQLGASFGLGVLVFFGVFIASLIGLRNDRRSPGWIVFADAVVCDVVCRGDGGWRHRGTVDHGPRRRVLAILSARGGWCDRGAHRHQRAVHRILGRPDRDYLGHGRHFAGDLSPAAADAGAQHSVHAVAAAEFAAAAAHHGGRHLVNVGGI